jgi:hypothetical protein
MMSYFAASFGASMGMMIALLIFSNAWRLGLLPKDYDFIHEFGNALIKLNNKKVSYSMRMIIGVIAHPVIFVYVWCKDGFLGINPLGSSILSAIILLLIESGLFSIGIIKGIPMRVPKKHIGTIVILQFTIHGILGILMGLSYDFLPV